MCNTYSGEDNHGNWPCVANIDLLPPPGGYVIILVCMYVCVYVCMCVCL